MKKLLMLLALMMPMMAFGQIICEDSVNHTKEAMFEAILKKIGTGKNSVVTYAIKDADINSDEFFITWEKKDCTGWGKHWFGNLKGEILVQVRYKFFRISQMDGMVSYRRGQEYEDLSSATPEDRKTMIADLANVQTIFPDERPTFKTSEIEYHLKVAEKKLSMSPKYLKPKDEEKGKVNPEYTSNYLYLKAFEGMSNDLKTSVTSIVDDVIAAIKELK